MMIGLGARDVPEGRSLDILAVGLGAASIVRRILQWQLSAVAILREGSQQPAPLQTSYEGLSVPNCRRGKESQVFGRLSPKRYLVTPQRP